MRILYIAPFVPWRVRVRSRNILAHLAKRHEVAAVCMARSENEAQRADSLRSLCREIVCVRLSRYEAALRCALCLPTPVPLRIAYSFSFEMRKAIRHMIRDFSPDVLYVDRWRALPNVPVNVRVPVICDPTDSMLLYNTRLIRAGAWWERLLGLEEAVKFLWYERRLAARASSVVFCSRLDLEVARGKNRSPHYEVIPNGVDCQKFFFKGATAEEESNRIVFTGNFGYPPNRRSMLFFLKNVLPLVRNQFPSVRLAVVGNEVERLGDLLGSPGVEGMGFVPDLRSHIARAAISVVPIRVGAGVPNKLLEAFATGTAVVATPMACGDLPVQHGEHLLLADAARDFADATVRLLRNPELRLQLAFRARRLVETQYSLQAMSQKLEEILLRTIRSEPGRERPPAEDIRMGREEGELAGGGSRW